MPEFSRRRFLTGLTLVVAAPMIVRAASIMPVMAVEPTAVIRRAFVPSGNWLIQHGPWTVTAKFDGAGWLTEIGDEKFDLSSVPEFPCDLRYHRERDEVRRQFAFAPSTLRSLVFMNRDEGFDVEFGCKDPKLGRDAFGGRFISS